MSHLNLRPTNPKLLSKRTWLRKLILLSVFAILLITTAVIAQTEQPDAQRGTDTAVFLPAILTPSNVPILIPPTYSGEGTYYHATGAGNCSFDPSPQNLMVAAMNQIDYDNSAICGAYIQVNGPLGSIIVRVVDRCPECPQHDVDLSQEAFAQIANLADGRVPITWQLVSQPLDGPIVYHFKDGSNQWWTAVQIRNHRNPVVSVEYWNGSQWVNAPRQEWNYFVEASGMGPSPYMFRVTDIFGNILIDSGIPHIENGGVAGQSQFPAP